MLADHTDDNWPVVAADLRDTLLRSGVSAAIAERVFAAVAPAVAVIERERGVVEDELLWALVAVAADSFQHARPDHLISGHIRRTQKDLQNTFGRKKLLVENIDNHIMRLNILIGRWNRYEPKKPAGRK